MLDKWETPTLVHCFSHSPSHVQIHFARSLSVDASFYMADEAGILTSPSPSPTPNESREGKSKSRSGSIGCCPLSLPHQASQASLVTLLKQMNSRQRVWSESPGSALVRSSVLWIESSFRNGEQNRDLWHVQAKEKLLKEQWGTVTLKTADRLCPLCGCGIAGPLVLFGSQSPGSPPHPPHQPPAQLLSLMESSRPSLRPRPLSLHHHFPYCSRAWPWPLGIYKGHFPLHHCVLHGPQLPTFPDKKGGLANSPSPAPDFLHVLFTAFCKHLSGHSSSRVHDHWFIPAWVVIIFQSSRVPIINQPKEPRASVWWAGSMKGVCLWMKLLVSWVLIKNVKLRGIPTVAPGVKNPA